VSSKSESVEYMDFFCNSCVCCLLLKHSFIGHE
jgi:hypothetical protein